MPADAFSRMDSSGSASDSNDHLLGTSPGAASSSSVESRERTDSEGSDRQPRFVLPASGTSPEKVLTMDEVQKALLNIENMTLAHEIAVNPDFRLKQFKAKEHSLERNIKEMIHRAFWTSIRDQLAEDPPCYDHAITLLADIKDGFSHIITTNNQKALDRICEVLDETVIRQQAEQGVLDFKAYATFIIHIMGKSCAPVRDEAVAALNEIPDVLDTFRGILEVMELMKLDMANCLIESMRKTVATHAIEYERDCFKEYLKLYQYGFPNTERWLMRHKPENQTDSKWVEKSIINAYAELLDTFHEFPETVDMDKTRIIALAEQSLRLCITASALIITSALPVIGGNTANRLTVKKEVSILLEGVKNEKDLSECIEHVWLQLKKIINSRLVSTGSGEMDATTEESLHTQIQLLTNRDSPIRSLMSRRLFAYARLVAAGKSAPPPPGYSEFVEELTMFGLFRRITSYNYSVFGEFYHKVLTAETTQSDPTSSSSTSAEPSTQSTSNGSSSSLPPQSIVPSSSTSE